MKTTTRRDFVAGAAGLGSALALGSKRRVFAQAKEEPKADAAKPFFTISLAEWSLHRMLQARNFEHLSFPGVATKGFGIDAVEYVSQFFTDKACDLPYLTELRKMCEHTGVESRLIMVDGEGSLAAADEAERAQAIENHRKWIVAAWTLGCIAVRVNAYGSGEPEAQMSQAAASLRALAAYADPYGIDVIVENHGGISSNGKWMAGVMTMADHPRVGTLPDFGNFHLGGDEWYDRYEGVREMMPWARAVSAKSYEFDKDGNEVRTDFKRMMKIVVDAGYHDRVGIEYEGDKVSEPEGVHLTKALLERVRDELAAEAR